MKPFKKILALILVIAVAELVPFGLSKYITDFFGQYISQRTASGYFILALIHRGSQFILALILIKLVFKEKLSLSFFLISSFCLDGFTGYINNLYPLGMGWMLAKLGRDILLLDAFAEEILFRLFVILFFERYWTGRVKIYKWTISHATLLSVPIFVFAHVSISIYPFKILAYDPIQLLLTAFTGLLFGLAFEKSRSLLAPIVIHGYTNLIITVAGYLTVIL